MLVKLNKGNGREMRESSALPELGWRFKKEPELSPTFQTFGPLHTALISIRAKGVLTCDVHILTVKSPVPGMVMSSYPTTTAAYQRVLSCWVCITFPLSPYHTPFLLKGRPQKYQENTVMLGRFFLGTTDPRRPQTMQSQPTLCNHMGLKASCPTKELCIKGSPWHY